ncbi:hypothetical protein H4582DRAFT_467247 [Lactarius indigo]|nr:hypothetical protein H4582DRAFT_467247 [Lactarius indigo]
MTHSTRRSLSPRYRLVALRSGAEATTFSYLASGSSSRLLMILLQPLPSLLGGSIADVTLFPSPSPFSPRVDTFPHCPRYLLLLYTQRALCHTFANTPPQFSWCMGNDPSPWVFLFPDLPLTYRSISSCLYVTCSVSLGPPRSVHVLIALHRFSHLLIPCLLPISHLLIYTCRSGTRHWLPSDIIHHGNFSGTAAVLLHSFVYHRNPLHASQVHLRKPEKTFY